MNCTHPATHIYSLLADVCFCMMRCQVSPDCLYSAVLTTIMLIITSPPSCSSCSSRSTTIVIVHRTHGDVPPDRVASLHRLAPNCSHACPMCLMCGNLPVSKEMPLNTQTFYLHAGSESCIAADRLQLLRRATTAKTTYTRHTTARVRTRSTESSDIRTA